MAGCASCSSSITSTTDLGGVLVAYACFMQLYLPFITYSEVELNLALCFMLNQEITFEPDIKSANGQFENLGYYILQC